MVLFSCFIIYAFSLAPNDMGWAKRNACTNFHRVIYFCNYAIYLDKISSVSGQIRSKPCDKIFLNMGNKKLHSDYLRVIITQGDVYCSSHFLCNQQMNFL